MFCASPIERLLLQRCVRAGALVRSLERSIFLPARVLLRRALRRFLRELQSSACCRSAASARARSLRHAAPHVRLQPVDLQRAAPRVPLARALRKRAAPHVPLEHALRKRAARQSLREYAPPPAPAIPRLQERVRWRPAAPHFLPPRALLQRASRPVLREPARAPAPAVPHPREPVRSLRAVPSVRLSRVHRQQAVPHVPPEHAFRTRAARHFRTGPPAALLLCQFSARDVPVAASSASFSACTRFDRERRITLRSDPVAP